MPPLAVVKLPLTERLRSVVLRFETARSLPGLLSRGPKHLHRSYRIVLLREADCATSKTILERGCPVSRFPQVVT